MGPVATLLRMRLSACRVALRAAVAAWLSLTSLVCFDAGGAHAHLVGAHDAVGSDRGDVHGAVAEPVLGTTVSHPACADGAAVVAVAVAPLEIGSHPANGVGAHTHDLTPLAPGPAAVVSGRTGSLPPESSGTLPLRI